MKRFFIVASLLALTISFMMSACHAPRQHYAQPQETLGAARTSIQEGRSLAFIDTLSSEVRNEYQDVILIGWGRVRKAFGFLANDYSIDSIEDYDPKKDFTLKEKVDALEGGDQWLWPNTMSTNRYQRVTIEVEYEGKTFKEPLLFVQELDEVSEESEASPWVRVGEQWMWRDDHPNPDRHGERALSIDERLNWRILYPYYPFNGESELAVALQKAFQQSGG